MKWFVIFLFLISASFFTFAFGQTQTICNFGSETTPGDEIFQKDLAVKAFVEKYLQANRTNTPDSSGSTDGTLTFKAQTQSEKTILSIEYRLDENGCYRPKTYHYSYDDGQIDVTVRNTLGSFSEIIRLIKTDDKNLQDFYSKNCSFVELDYSIFDGKMYGICKDNESPAITIQAKANSDGTMQVNIPLEMVYTLNSRDCTISNDFFVTSARGESPYEITPTKIGNLVSVDLKEGPNKITIAGTTIIPDPSPAQYCGIVMGYDSQFLPPKQQTNRGVEPRFIQCNDDYELLVKYNGTPSCVSPEHRSDFLKRGWNIPEKHTVFSKPNVDETMEIKIQEISKNSILSKGIGFDLPDDMFTPEDYQNLRQKENELKKIISTQNISMEEREQIIAEINSMQERLWYPFQTGVPYQLVQMLKEKNEILMSDWVEFLETGVHITDAGDDISHEHQALIVGVHPDSFTLQQIEKLDKELREKMGNEMNILYKKSQGIVPSN